MSVLGGLWWAFCFDAGPGSALPLFVSAPLFVIAIAPGGSLRRLLLGWLHGLVAWLIALPWIASTLVVYGGIPWVVSALLLVGLALYLGLCHGLFCWLAGFALRRHDRLSLLLLPAIWGSLEWLRGLGAAGFPWNLLGYAWVDVPGALEATRFVGSHGLSALVAATGFAAVRLAVSSTRRQAAVALAVVAAFLLAARFAVRDRPEAAGPRMDIAIVQPDIYMETANEAAASTDARFARIRRNYERLFELSREACRPGTLVIWPESAGWPYQVERDEGFARDVERLVAGGCSVLLNSARRSRLDGGEERALNAAYLLSPGAGTEAVERQTYDKMHLVPFGEYVPLGRYLPMVRQVARQAGGFSPGDEVRLLDADGVLLGVSICFEIVFPQKVALRVRRGARVLATMTNDSWYGSTWAPHQHLRAARFRAAETGRPLARAAITGISAIVDDRGRVVASLDIGEMGVLRAEIEPLGGTTPFVRLPWLVPLLCLGLSGFAILRR